MALSSDILLERMHLKRQITFWRLFAIGAIIFFAVMLFEKSEGNSPVSGDYIGRVVVSGVVTDDRDLYRLIDNIRNNERVRALILWCDTPGGTAVGGETLHHKLKAVASVKPVVVVMRDLCASAGYMTAVAGDHVIARAGTLTGSIGVIVQTGEITRLANKLGITPITIKTGVHKAAPSPFEKLDPEQRAVVESAIYKFFESFVTMVARSRDLEESEVLKLADGRIFSGEQALEAGLVDAIGGEEEALEWLRKEKRIEKLQVRDLEVKRKKDNVFEQLLGYAGFPVESAKALKLDGLLAIWQPALL